MSNLIDNIRRYALEAGDLQDQGMEVDGLDAKTRARLDQTIKELQDRLRTRQLELEKVGIDSWFLLTRISHLHLSEVFGYRSFYALQA
jgi:hypothetical protein